MWRKAAKMTGTEMTYELYAGLSDYIPNHVTLRSSPRVHGGDRGPEIRRGGLCPGVKIPFHETATPDEMEAKRASLRKLFGADHMEEIEAHPLHTSIIAPLVWNGKVQAGSTDVGDASYVDPDRYVHNCYRNSRHCRSHLADDRPWKYGDCT